MLSVSLVCAGAVGEEAGAAVKFDEGKPSPAKLGYAGYAKELDKTVYTGQLGALYSKKSTTFRLWSPVASSVRVCIYQTGSDAEEGAKKISATAMKYSESTGAWYQTVNGDLKNLYYTYEVTIGDQVNEVVDPYARAVGVNGNRGMIIDLDDTDPAGWDEDSFERVGFASDAVVWEVSVRDFSADETCGVTAKNRGKFLAFTESDTSLNREGDIATCVAYLRELGVNYVQINPFYDFASIDETDTGSGQYNWGYDPKNYNVPEGSYSSNPYDGRVRIKECKEMIQALHNAGIGVIMDVVYNHTYYSEDSFFNQIVPYYYHRINEDGSWSNGSGCGNDVATERYMVRRYIRESVAYWAQEYHIDGFRFDLMGLMDVTCMNSIRATLDKLPNGDRIIMYGEAWNMNTTVPADVQLANQNNLNLLSKRIGAFNDTARDAIKGSVFNADTGFVQEGKSRGGVKSAISADGGGWATIPNQCVNYASCHDNLTLYDKLTNSVYHDDQYRQRREDLVAMNKLSAAVVMMSRGMPFILAGEEMARTKLGDENSYISPVEINQIDWSSVTKYTSLIDYYKGLIRLRQAVGVLNDPTGNHSTLSYIETEGKGGIAYTSSGEGFATIVAAFNGNPTDEITVPLPEGKWVILADGDRAGLVSLGTAEGTLKVAHTSAAVLVDADSYAAIEASGDEAVVYVRYVDKATSETVYEQRSSGAIGEAYSLKAPSEVNLYYDITGDADVLSGTYEEPCRIVTIECEPYEGGCSTVTVLYLDDDGHQLADSVVISNRIGQQYYVPAFPAIPGYRLDISRLPENASGSIGDQPIVVEFRYLPDSGESVPAGSDKTCRANIIYLGDQGQILEVRTVTGAEGETIEIEELSFSGFRYISTSDNYAVFERNENNLLVNYAKAASTVWIWFAAAGAAILLAGGVLFLSKRISRRAKIGAVDIEE